MKITVVGSGAWGTALALLLLENGNDVTLWSYHQEESNRMRDTHENPMLKGVPLPEELKLTTDLSSVKGCGLVVLATPPSLFEPPQPSCGSWWTQGPLLYRCPRELKRIPRSV